LRRIRAEPGGDCGWSFLVALEVSIPWDSERKLRTPGYRIAAFVA